MRIYEQKSIDYCFVIICIDSSVGLLKNTVESIRQHHSVPTVCVVPENTDPEIIGLLKLHCEVLRGGSTVTSLVNTGILSSPRPWAFLVFSGSVVRPRMDEKYSYYIDRETDILFPVVGNMGDFIDGTMNGMLVHRDNFRRVGLMPEDDSLNESKAAWAYEAINLGCRFKAIVGGKIC